MTHTSMFVHVSLLNALNSFMSMRSADCAIFQTTRRGRKLGQTKDSRCGRWCLQAAAVAVVAAVTAVAGSQGAEAERADGVHTEQGGEARERGWRTRKGRGKERGRGAERRKVSEWI